MQRFGDAGQARLGRGLPVVAGHELQVSAIFTHAARLIGSQCRRRRRLPHGGPPLLGPRQKTHRGASPQVEINFSLKIN